MAKDTEKLIRQLSLISFLMAQGRPVSALEIKREVEGYSDMNDDAFARRFYADRAELESLGITLQVEKPGESMAGYEAELYSLPPENYYLPEIEFGDDELAALRTALHLLDGEFAYAEPLRLALQQVSWGRPSPLNAPEESSVEVRMTAKADGAELSGRLSKIETAISRRKTIDFTYYTIDRDSEEKRRVDPYHLVYRGGQFYLIGHSHEREAVRVFRLSRIRGKVSYASKAEHDFGAAQNFDRRDYAGRAEWQLGQIQGTAKIFLRDRIAWLVERDFGSYGEIRPARKADGAPAKGQVFETEYASPLQMVAWALRWRQNVTVLAPPELADEVAERLELMRGRHAGEFETARLVRRRPAPVSRSSRGNGRSESAIRPERFARLVTLAGMLIESAKEENNLQLSEVSERLHLSEEELLGDIELLNVVNFGGGTYVLYAEVVGDEIEVDSQPYGDSFARPARLLPLEAKALVAAIDLFGDHLPQTGLATARDKITEALGHDPSEEGLEIAASGGDDSETARKVNEAIAAGRVLAIHYYKENEDEFTKREIEPYRLANGSEGWYVASWDRRREDVRHFRLDRIKEASITEESFEPRPEIEELAAMEGWLAGGQVPAADVARIWVSPERARWMREQHQVAGELADGAIVIEVPYGSIDWLVREVLKGAGELVVLEPAEARELISSELEAEVGAPAAARAA
ncbi:MAG: WYL domain-containing protein [Solirubrobacterales bacterium]|nr:WYL domain-containing protein [Solirubrobacterales bacterium]